MKAEDKRENLLVLGLFLGEILEENGGKLNIDGVEMIMDDYMLIYGELSSVLNIETKIKNITYQIKRQDEKYIKDYGNVLTFIDSKDRLVNLRCQ